MSTVWTMDFTQTGPTHVTQRTRVIQICSASDPEDSESVQWFGGLIPDDVAGFMTEHFIFQAKHSVMTQISSFPQIISPNFLLHLLPQPTDWSTTFQVDILYVLNCISLWLKSGSKKNQKNKTSASLQALLHHRKGRARSKTPFSSCLSLNVQQGGDSR